MPRARTRSPASSGKLVVDALAAQRPGMPVAWTPSLEDAVRFLSRRARPGDLVLTIGAGDVERAGPLILEELAMKIEEGVELSRHTTVGTGGPAAAFARPETLDELGQALAWARERELPVATVGLGSNLLVADEGFDGLVLRLAGELATRRDPRTSCLVAGGGAANAVCLHRARDAGLGGFEFACAIPGTVGGGVWMNAGAYGSDWAAILERALVVERRRAALAGAVRARAHATGTRSSTTARSSRAPSSGSRRSRWTRSRRPSPSFRPCARPRSRPTSARSAASSRTPTTS